jgi:phage gp29-like protein
MNILQKNILKFATKMAGVQNNSLSARVIMRNESVTRKDISDYRNALQEAGRAQNPKQVRLQSLLETIRYDALLSSQIDLRIDRTQCADFVITDTKGNEDQEATCFIRDSGIFNTTVELIIEAMLYGHSLFEFEKNDYGILTPKLIDRKHVSPKQGVFYGDVTDIEGIPYRDTREYGLSLIEINCNRGTDYGLMTKAVPHILMKKFAQSCWSELCEIYGIPPRVLKTDTTSPEMLERANKMMNKIGAAAWFIIDTTEEFNFAQTATGINGDVYKNLISLCNAEISMLITGAVVGQDTQHGNRSKEESAQKLAENVILADQRFVESQFNQVVLPALGRTGNIREGLQLNIKKETDIEKLWQMTRESLPFFDVNEKWIRETFGVEIKGARNASPDSQFSFLNAPYPFAQG